jgi:hypothetical protein
MSEIESRVHRLRSYLRDQIAQGAEHVESLLRQESERILELTAGVSEEEAAFSPAPGEWSVSQVTQHLIGGYERNRARVDALMAGRAYGGPPTVPGTIPDERFASFADVRNRYVNARDAIVALVRTGDPSRNLQFTTDHVVFGFMNWLEWALFTLDVHSRDHRGQIEKIRALQKGT